MRLAAQQLTGRDPELLVNSHYHNDHIWGNQVFSPQASILSTSQTRKLIETEGQEELRWARETAAGSLEEYSRKYAAEQDEHKRQDLHLWVGYFQALVDNMPALTIRVPDITFEDRLTIHGSSSPVELLAFHNSHCGSDTILVLPEARIIFMADLLFVKSHPFLAECDVFALLDSLKQISGMNATVFVPGHGPLGTAGDLATNADYISICVDTARNIVAAR